MRVRVRKSKMVENVARRLQRVARGHVVAETAEQFAPVLQKAMRKDIKPHNRTGAAYDRARVTAEPDSITIHKVAYLKFVKGVIWGRRVPGAFFTLIKKRLGANARKAIRGDL